MAVEIRPPGGPEDAGPPQGPQGESLRERTGPGIHPLTRKEKGDGPFPLIGNPHDRENDAYYGTIDRIRDQGPFQGMGRTEVPYVGYVDREGNETRPEPGTHAGIRALTDEMREPGPDHAVTQEYYDTLDRINSEGPFQRTGAVLGKVGHGLMEAGDYGAEFAANAKDIYGPKGLAEMGRTVRDEVLTTDALRETGRDLREAVVEIPTAVVNKAVDTTHGLWAGRDVEGYNGKTVHKDGVKEKVQQRVEKTRENFKQDWEESPRGVVRRTAVGTGLAGAAVYGLVQFHAFVNEDHSADAADAQAARTPDTAAHAPAVAGSADVEGLQACEPNALGKEFTCDTPEGTILASVTEPLMSDRNGDGIKGLSVIAETDRDAAVDLSGGGQQDLLPGEAMTVPLEAEEGSADPGYSITAVRNPEGADTDAALYINTRSNAVG
jgi:hypothetical protein